jgi:hypothetical protein
MADDVIKSFLIGLGFKVDEEGLKKFNAAIQNVEKSAKQFAVGFSALAIGIEESIRRVGRQFENLFFLSAQLGTSANNLKSLEFAFGQIGIGADAFKGSLQSLNRLMLDSPGMKHFIAGLVPGFNAASGTAEQALGGLIDRYEQLLKMPAGPLKDAEIANYRDLLEKTLHVNADMIAQGARFNTERKKWAEESKKWLASIGLDADKSGKLAFEAMQSWGFLWMQISTIFEKFTLTVFPLLKPLLDWFGKWMTDVAAPKVKELAADLERWFSNRENIEDFKQKLDAAGKVIAELWGAVKVLIGWLGKLNEVIGATGTALVVLFGFSAIKAIIGGLVQGAIAVMFAPLVAAAGVAGQAAGTSFRSGFLGKLALAGIILEGTTSHGVSGLIPTSRTPEEERKHWQEQQAGEQRARAEEKARGESSSDAWGIQQGFNKAWDWLGLPKANDAGRPHSYDGPPIGGQGSMLDNMVLGFQHWWAGSGNFRPRVDLVDTIYNKIADVLRDVFDLHPGADKPTTGSTGTGGTGVGEVHGGSGMPGRSGGGRVRPDSGGAPGAGDLSQAALEAIAKGEGTLKPGGGINYNVVYGGKSVDLEHMTLNKVLEMQKDMIGRLGASPVGGFQINKQTLEGLIKQLKLDPETTTMSPAIQQQMASQLYRTRGLQPWSNPQTASGETQRAFAQLQQSGGLWAGGAGGAEGPAGGHGLARGRDLSGVREALVATVDAAAKMMPEGYKVVPTSGLRPGDSGQHGHGNAVDVQIIGPDGKPIANRGEDVTGMYRQFAHAWFNAAQKMYPQLAEQAAWGGEFGTEKGGGGPKDLMHVDFGGRRGRYRREDWRYVSKEANERIGAYNRNFGEAAEPGGESQRDAFVRRYGMSPEAYRQSAGTTRNVNVDADHKVTINIHGAQSATKTAQAVEEIQKRHALVAARNLRAAVA